MNYKGAVETVSSKASRAIVVFSKAPELGKVKTRLQSSIGDKNCLALHLAMLQDTLECCTAVNGAHVTLYLTTLMDLPFATSVPVRIQADGDLGFRMLHAFRENLKNFISVVIVGADAPALTPFILDEAFLALENHDLVLGPSEDGGYYLIGLKRMLTPEIFHNIPWSTSDVLQLTLQRSPAYLLPVLYDIDLPEDLRRLQDEMRSGMFSHARHTKILDFRF